MKAILGRKIGMSQMFTDSGEAVAVTIVSAVPNDVTLRRNKERDGYQAVQLGLPKDKQFNNQTDNSIVQAEPKGKKYHAKREFFIEVDENIQQISVQDFAPGEMVEVAGVSKGKGFQGVVKRHGMKGGPASHGHRHVLRSAGSIGSRFPQHVRKGKRMAGRMGGDRVTVKNLKVMWVDKDNNLLAIGGALPGTAGSLVEIVSQVKAAEK